MLEMRLNKGSLKIGDDGKMNVSEDVADMIRANVNDGEEMPEFNVIKDGTDSTDKKQLGQQL